MKRLLKNIVLILVLTMCMTTVAFAAVGDKVEGSKADIILEDADTTIIFDTVNAEKMLVSVASNKLVPGNQYLVLVIAGDGSKIDEDTILYIDQAAAGGTDKGTLDFEVYPSAIKDSVILITGVADGQLKLAVIDAKYILGDANMDGKVNAADIVRIAKMMMNKADKNDPADANEDGSVNAADIVRVAKIMMGKA